MKTRKIEIENVVHTREQTREFLYCSKCGTRFSANAGDYFDVSDKYIFKCNCRARIILAASTEVITERQAAPVRRGDLRNQIGGK